MYSYIQLYKCTVIYNRWGRRTGFGGLHIADELDEAGSHRVVDTVHNVHYIFIYI